MATFLVQRTDPQGFVTFLDSDDDSFVELSETESGFATEFSPEDAKCIVTGNPWFAADEAAGCKFEAVDAESTFREAGLI